MRGELPEALVRLFVPDKSSPKSCSDKNPWCAIGYVSAMLGFVVFLTSSKVILIPLKTPTMPAPVLSTMLKGLSGCAAEDEVLHLLLRVVCMLNGLSIVTIILYWRIKQRRCSWRKGFRLGNLDDRPRVRGLFGLLVEVVGVPWPG